MNEIILVVAAHPDDEALGCGGTIAKHVANGDHVHVVFMADGVGSRGGEIAEAMQERVVAMNTAAKILGTSSTTCLGFPDNRMDSMALIDIVQPLETVIERLNPEIIYTHHCGDLNVDHRLTHQSVMTACRPLPGSSVREILAFEVLSSTEWQSPSVMPFVPNVAVDISHHLHTKLAAVDAYALEMREAPHSRSVKNVEALALYRGHSAGVKASEAMILVRSLRK
jgi:LmbE family N-acetylglucosaminyl deacetylase